jgi:hypothetical protein
MRPPKRSSGDFEPIKQVDEWIPGVIEDVTLQEDRATGFNDEETGEPVHRDMVRFKFKLSGHEYPHYSRWMAYSFHEKANLSKILFKLVEGFDDKSEFDIDRLKGLSVKTMWSQNGQFYNLDQIRPAAAKLMDTGRSGPGREDPSLAAREQWPPDEVEVSDDPQ